MRLSLTPRCRLRRFHIAGSWLEQYDWFMTRRYRHFYHHGHLRQNMSLGGIDPTFDLAFGTYTSVETPTDRSAMPRRKA